MITLFTDPGIDDALAIVMACKEPSSSERLICSVEGNVTARQARDNALRLVALAESDLEVFAGKQVPSNGKRAYEIHGVNGLGGVSLPTTPRRSRTEADLIRRLGASVAWSAVCLGPLSELAWVLMTQPKIGESLKSVTVMGGSRSAGNVTPSAEFNIYSDPAAAKVVFGSGIRTRLIPLDVTQRVILRQSDYADLVDKARPLSWQIGRMLNAYIATERRQERINGCYPHDPVAYASLLWPELFEFRDASIEVLDSPQDVVGKTNIRGVSLGVEGKAMLRVAVDVDVSTVKRRILRLLFG